MHIVYASDRNFAKILGVSVVSLFENNVGSTIKLHILDSGIGVDGREKIENVCQLYGQEIPQWITVENIQNELNISVVADRGSMSQFARIFVSRHIDESIDRILYLDCDTIIRKPIKDLWNTDLKGKTIAVLNDAFSKYYRANIDLAPDDIMFNSGVMLIDLKKWREQNVERYVLDFIRQKKGFVEKGDQGALNAVLSHDCVLFDPKYNAVTIFFDFSYKEMLRYRRPPGYYPDEQIRKAVENPVIIHYTVSFLSKRPWMKGCGHPWTDEWLKYKAMSPWADTPLIEEKRSWRVHAIRKLPRGLMLWIAGLLQVYGRPWLYQIRMRRIRRKDSDQKR